MIVRCIRKNYGDLDVSALEVLRGMYGPSQGEENNLDIGELYVVYALFKTPELSWFFLARGGAVWGPLWYPDVFFEVIENSASRYWMQTQRYHLSITNSQGDLYAFPEYTEEPDYYERLIEFNDSEVQIFKHYATKIRDEMIY